VQLKTKAKTERKRRKDKSAMLENKAIQQDPKSKARFDQLPPESKEVRYQNLAANYKKDKSIAAATCLEDKLDATPVK
jgi:hypothetical protein